LKPELGEVEAKTHQAKFDLDSLTVDDRAEGSGVLSIVAGTLARRSESALPDRFENQE
jgi:hypothetical protein